VCVCVVGVLSPVYVGFFLYISNESFTSAVGLQRRPADLQPRAC
jgi:hypothetical protein